jgi:hypothetical protein
MLNHLSKVVLL